MEEHVNPNQPPEPPVAPPPRPQWTPPPLPPLPVYAAHKKELIFGLALLICNISMWDFIIAGGFSLGFAIGAVCVILCSVGYLLSTGHRPDWYSGSLIGLSIVIAAAFGRSADGFVKYVMMHFLLLAMNLGLCLLAGRNRYPAAGFTSLADAPRALFVLGFGGMGAAGRGLKEARKNAGKFGKQTVAVAVGLAVAVPILVVLIWLLMQADAAFEGLLDLLPEADWHEYFLAALLGTLAAWILYARGVALRRAPKAAPRKSSFKGINGLTINTILIAVCLVYGAYLLSQLAYLSGGFSGILPEEYTMAEYARRGFFEMAWLCAINLVIIGCGVGLICREGKAPLLTRLLCLFIGLITVFLVATASAKMFMYIGSYGLTRLRVLTEVIMIWLGLSTVLVCLWLFIPKLPYMKAVLLLALAMGAGVIWADVDTQVARYNVRAYQSGALETVDVSHLNDLGPGALPYLIELTEDQDPLIAEMARDSLMGIHYRVEDFRDWNLAKASASAILEEMRAEESAEAAAHLTEALGLEAPREGYYLLESIEISESREHDYSRTYIQISAGGSGTICSEGQTFPLNWTDRAMIVEGEAIGYTLEGDILLLSNEDMTMTFRYNGQELPEDYLVSFTGGYFIVSSVGENGSTTFYSAPDPANGYLLLNEDGTGTLSYGGQEGPLTWDETTLYWGDQELPYEYQTYYDDELGREDALLMFYLPDTMTSVALRPAELAA